MLNATLVVPGTRNQRANLRRLFAWLPLAVTLLIAPVCAAEGLRDIDPAFLGRSNPLPPRGEIVDVVVQDGIAYCAMEGFGLVMYDVRDPSRPSFIGGHELNGGDWTRALAVAVSGTYVCVAGFGHWNPVRGDQEDILSVFDVTQPAEPRLLGQTTWAGGWPSEVVIAGRNAFVAFERGGLQAIDLSDPTRPQALGRVELGQPEWPVDARGLAVAGEYAYVAYNTSWTACGVKVIRIREPERPQVVADLPMAGDAGNPGPGGGWAITTRGAYAFVADGSAGLVVLDISSPAAPTRVTGCQWPGGGTTLALAGDFAYVGDGGGRIQAIDVSDPAQPLLLVNTDPNNGTGLPYSVADLTTSDGHLYAALRRRGLGVWSLKDPGKPQFVGAVETHGFPHAIAMVGQHLVLAEGWSGLQIMDVSDPKGARRVAGHATEGEVLDLVVQGSLAYTVARKWDASAEAEQWTVETFDLSDLINPRRLGRFRAAGPVERLSVFEQHAWLIGPQTEIVDVSDPANPTRDAVCAAPCPLSSPLAVEGERIVVATEGGVAILEMQDPTRPKPLGKIAVAGQLVGLALSGDRLLLNTYSENQIWLQIVDVSDPTAPRLLGKLAGVVGKIMATAHRAYLLSGRSVHAIDLTDPAQPAWIGTAHLPSHALTAAAIGSDRLLVVEALVTGPLGKEWTTGIELIEFSRWANPQRMTTISLPKNQWSWRVLGTAGTRVCISSTSYADTRRSDTLAVLDLSDPSQPTILGPAIIGDQIADLEMQGARAYLATGTSGLQIFDISASKAPTRLGGINTGSITLEVSVSGDVVCVKDKHNQLSIIDVSDPTSPQPVAVYKTSLDIHNVAQAGNLAFLSANDGLHLLDLTTPSAPKLLAWSVELGGWSGLAVSGSRAYMCFGGAIRALVILDLARPAEPRELGRALVRQGSELEAVGIAVLQDYAYVLTYGVSSTVEVFDVSNPAKPVRVGGNSALNGYRVATVNDGILVAGDNELTLMHPFVPLRIEPTAWHVLGSGVSVMGPPGWPIRVQRSADLTRWQDWRTLSSSGAPVEFSDPEAGAHPHRFYRAVAP